MALLGILIVTLALFHATSAKSVENLAVECFSDGTFKVYLSGNLWFRRGTFAVRANSSWWATDEKTLEIVSQSTGIKGSDAIGEFTSCEYTWKAVSNASEIDLQVNTYINVYDDVPVVTFAIAYLTAARDTAIPGVYNRTISSFPSFYIEETTPMKRGYATWAGNSRSPYCTRGRHISPVEVFASRINNVHW